MEENPMIIIQIENDSCVIVPYDSNIEYLNALSKNINKSPLKLNNSISVSLTLSNSENEDEGRENINNLNEYNNKELEISYKSIFYSDKKIKNEEKEDYNKENTQNEVKNIKNENIYNMEKLKQSNSQTSLLNKDIAKIKLIKNKKKQINEKKNKTKFLSKNLSISKYIKKLLQKKTTDKYSDISNFNSNNNNNNNNNCIGGLIRNKSISHRNLSKKTEKFKLSLFKTSNLIRHNSISSSLILKKNNNKLSTLNFPKTNFINVSNGTLQKNKVTSNAVDSPIQQDSNRELRNLIIKSSFNKSLSKQKFESNDLIINNINQNKKVSLQIATSPKFTNNNIINHSNGGKIKKVRTINNFSKYIKTKNNINSPDINIPLFWGISKITVKDKDINKKTSKVFKRGYIN